MKNTIEKQVRRLIDEVWNQGDYEVLHEIFAPDFVIQGDEPITGIEPVKKQIDTVRKGVPDFHCQVDDLIITDDKVILQWQGRGMQTGILGNIKPTKREYKVQGVTIFKYQNDLLTEATIVSSDREKALQNLFVVSNKQYSEKDFSVDFNGPAGDMYQWMYNARATPCVRQAMINGVRKNALTIPATGEPALQIPSELYQQVSVEEIMISGDEPDVRCLVYSPQKNNDQPYAGILIYLHGGGWSLGNPEGYDPLARKLALDSGYLVINVDYRLAPEAPFPAGLHDCRQVFLWLRKNAAQLNANPDHIVVAGDSAGGNLALALTLLLREHNDKPEALIPIVPGTDMCFENYSTLLERAENDISFDLPFYSMVRSLYAPKPSDWKNPLVSPIYGDLADFPPTQIIIAGEDCLCEENLAFAEKMKQAGNTVDVRVYENMPHTFYLFFGLADEVAQCHQDMVDFLKSQIK